MGKSRLTQEQVKQKQDELYLQGKASRIETMNYVNNLLQNNYTPMFMEQIEATRLAVMVLQAILIEKGICSGEDIQTATQAIIKAHKDKVENDNGENKQ